MLQKLRTLNLKLETLFVPLHPNLKNDSDGGIAQLVRAHDS